MYCSGCGAAVGKRVSFCSTCGHDLRSGTPPAVRDSRASRAAAEVPKPARRRSRKRAAGPQERVLAAFATWLKSQHFVVGEPTRHVGWSDGEVAESAEVIGEIIKATTNIPLGKFVLPLILSNNVS